MESQMKMQTLQESGKPNGKEHGTLTCTLGPFNGGYRDIWGEGKREKNMEHGNRNWDY